MLHKVIARSTMQYKAQLTFLWDFFLCVSASPSITCFFIFFLQHYFNIPTLQGHSLCFTEAQQKSEQLPQATYFSDRSSFVFAPWQAFFFSLFPTRSPFGFSTSTLVTGTPPRVVTTKGNMLSIFNATCNPTAKIWKYRKTIRSVIVFQKTKFTTQLTL